MDRLARGERCEPSEYYFRTCPVFETGAAEYQWLHGLVAVCAGERLPDRVTPRQEWILYEARYGTNTSA